VKLALFAAGPANKRDSEEVRRSRSARRGCSAWDVKGPARPSDTKGLHARLSDEDGNDSRLCDRIDAGDEEVDAVYGIEQLGPIISARMKM